jgi:hypothetical protein
MNESKAQEKVEKYITTMDENERNALRFGLTFMVSEISAYMHQLIDEGKEINHDLLTSMEHHYLQDLRPNNFEETLRLILKK